MSFKKLSSIVLVFLLVTSLTGIVSAKRILFYEVGTPGEYTIEGGYSSFANELRNRGYDVASITRGELSKGALENYDILVIQELRRGLKTEEISAILWFVMIKGSGVLINGGDPSNTNQLTIPFGITIDGGNLIDTTDSISGDDNRQDFTVDRFEENAMMRVVIQGIQRIGYYGGHGLYLSGSAISLATGDTDTYSDTGSFAAGSVPTVSAATLFGEGLVFVHSDADLLVNNNIQSYDNLRYGVSTIDWLTISAEPSIQGNMTWQEVQILINELKLENTRLTNQVDQLTEEKSQVISQYLDVSSQLQSATTELSNLKEAHIGPFTKSNWALIIVGVCILVAALVMSKRGGGASPTTESISGEELLSGLEYELGKEGDSGGDLESDLDKELDKI